MTGSQQLVNQLANSSIVDDHTIRQPGFYVQWH